MCRRLMRSPARRPLGKGTPTTGIRVFSDAVLLGFPGRVFCAVSQKELGREVSVQAALFIQLGAQTLDFCVLGVQHGVGGVKLRLKLPHLGSGGG